MRDASRVHLRIRGRVQGVGFRYTCAAMARTSSVNGWVRNLPDGGVEAVFEGDRDRVSAAVAWCRTGPPEASVSSVDVTEEIPEGLNGFRIR